MLVSFVISFTSLACPTGGLLGIRLVLAAEPQAWYQRSAAVLYAPRGPSRSGVKLCGIGQGYCDYSAQPGGGPLGGCGTGIAGSGGENIGPGAPIVIGG
jgi:hypothetical protein